VLRRVAVPVALAQLLTGTSRTRAESHTVTDLGSLDGPSGGASGSVGTPEITLEARG
jgi:hypothetical protein